MRVFCAGVLMALAVVLALYVGVWICLAGGIMGIVSVVTGTAGLAVLGWSILKILFAGLAGWLTFFAFWLPAMALLGKSKKKRLGRKL